jgi:hypothetical protein
MNEAVAVAEATLALLLAAVGLWHLFGFSKWLASGGGRRLIRRLRPKAKNAPPKKAPINPR